MNLIKNTIVVPSTTPTPNQDSERVALFNEDGSPFSAGGGGRISLQEAVYFQADANTVALSDFTLEAANTTAAVGRLDPLDNTGNAPPANFVKYQTNPLCSDSPDSGGFQINLLEELGPGVLDFTAYAEYVQTAPAANDRLNLQFEITDLVNWSVPTYYYFNAPPGSSSPSNMYMTNMLFIDPAIWEGAGVIAMYWYMRRNFAADLGFKFLHTSVGYTPS